MRVAQVNLIHDSAMTKTERVVYYSVHEDNHG